MFGVLWVANPTQSRLATNWKRVLRRYGRPCGRSVDSEPIGRVIEPRKRDCCRCRRRELDGRLHESPRLAWRHSACRGLRAGHVGMETPQEPGRSCHLHRQGIGCGQLENGPGPLAGRRRQQGANQRTLGWCRRARETGASGISGRKSECSIVVRKQGKSPRTTLGSEGSTGQWTRWRDR